MSFVRLTICILAVFLLLLSGMPSAVARVASYTSTSSQKSTQETYNQRIMLETRMGLLCYGNPVVYVDPTGRLGKGLFQGAAMGDYFEAENTAQGIGKFIGQLGVGFVPWVGQAADIRDFTAAWQLGSTQGWSFSTGAGLAMAGVAFVPGLGDAVKAGVKPLFGKPASAVADATKGTPNPKTGAGFGVTDSPVRIPGAWTEADFRTALRGRPPMSLGSPDLHHAGQMPGAAIHEILPELHQGNKALHPNKFNQGVTDEMRRQDRQLHWWYRAREQGADKLYPDWIYD
jgi:hypothetical protein